jgi:hypothetical protein
MHRVFGDRVEAADLSGEQANLTGAPVRGQCLINQNVDGCRKNETIGA